MVTKFDLLRQSPVVLLFHILNHNSIAYYSEYSLHKSISYFYIKMNKIYFDDEFLIYSHSEPLVL